MQHKKQFNLTSFLWDLWCVGSVVGIWPRFIEPNLLKTTKLTLPLAIPDDLNGLKILQFSDLHLHPRVPKLFINRLKKKIQKFKPDLIVFTGDFICQGQLKESLSLKKFLSQLNAPYGCYAVLGNHDYSSYVSLNSSGEYDTVKDNSELIKKGLGLILKKREIKGAHTKNIASVTLHKELCELLQQTPFQLLHNETKVIKIKDSFLNLCGLGEYMAGMFKPEQAFSEYNKNYPGIILAHNPDVSAFLKKYPGELILSGHTHGGQVNLFGIWRYISVLENPKLMRGLIQIDNKKLYVNRGVGSTHPFRWFAPPEILLLTLKKK